MHPGPCCPDRPFPEDLGDTKIRTRIQGVLAHGANQNLGSGPVPLMEGVDSPWVSPLGPTFGYLCQFLFLNVCVFSRRVSDVLIASHGGGTLLEDVARREANRA
jgi:hypothetical protein